MINMKNLFGISFLGVLFSLSVASAQDEVPTEENAVIDREPASQRQPAQDRHSIKRGKYPPL